MEFVLYINNEYITITVVILIGLICKYAGNTFSKSLK